MKFLSALFALALLACPAFAQSMSSSNNSTTSSNTKPKSVPAPHLSPHLSPEPAAPTYHPSSTPPAAATHTPAAPSTPATPPVPPPAAPGMSPADAAALQSAITHLTELSREQLDVLKKQQSLIEDMQYDQRIQRQRNQSLEERLAETLLENSQLHNKITNLETAAATTPHPSSPEAPNITQPVAPASAPPPIPPPPSTYLPPPDPPAPPGTQSWHRLFTLSGTDSKTSDIFHVEGRTWRIVWHNLDKPEKVYQNTSALFINAFPKDDTIPQKVCAKVGTGGDATELSGTGNYYLKIEASGGSWELAVEDFH